MPRHYNRYNQHRMTLNTAGFEPVVFNPIEFKPVEADYNILERSFAKQEERKQKAVQQHSLVKQALGKVREQLHEDDETAAWFNNYSNNIENNINEAAQVGDYAGALNVATQEAGNILNDAEVIGRIRSNEEYNEELKVQKARRDKGDISQDTYEWWTKNNPYVYNPIKDESGNIIGSQKYEPNSRPVDDIKWENVYALAKQLLTPKKGSSSGSTNVDSKGNILDITTGGGTQYESISPKDITETVKKIIGNNWAALKQDFEVRLYQLEKMQKEYENLPEGSQERMLKEQQYSDMQMLMTGNNGIQLTNDTQGWTTYYTRMVADGLYSDGLGYNWRFTEGSKIGKKSNVDSNLDGGGSNDGYGQYTPWSMEGGYNDMPTNLTHQVEQANSVASDAISAMSGK